MIRIELDEEQIELIEEMKKRRFSNYDTKNGYIELENLFWVLEDALCEIIYLEEEIKRLERKDNDDCWQDMEIPNPFEEQESK